MDKKMSEEEITKFLMNPYYAIDIHPSLFGEHEKPLSKWEREEGNRKVVEDIGLVNWLNGILNALEAGEPEKR